MTQVLAANDEYVVEAVAEIIASGQLAVIPTDTVYGIAARLTDDAILRLYLAKERTPDKAIPILIATIEDLDLVAQPLSPYAHRLADAFWPGPLTLVLPKRDGLPQQVSQLPTIGVRIPDNNLTRAIIQSAGGALAITSANVSGHPPAQTAQEVIDQLGESVSIVVDGGTCENDVASTVATIEGRTIRIVREGPITQLELQNVIDSYI
jgi:L-threonylcarbamoyladenylate synthase